jgi:Formyl transferase
VPFEQRNKLMLGATESEHQKSSGPLRIILFTIDESVFAPLATAEFMERYSDRIVQVVVSRTWFTKRIFKRLIQFCRLFIFSPRFIREVVLSCKELTSQKRTRPSRLAESLGIPVARIRRFDSYVIENLKLLNPDIFIFCPFDLIAGPKTLAVPRIGTFNIHFARLPEYQGGVSTFFWSIYNGDEAGGTTMHSVTTTLDSGQKVAENFFPIVGLSLCEYMKLGFEMGGNLLIENFSRVVDKNWVPLESPDRVSRYYNFPERNDLKEFWKRGNKVCG